MVMQVDGETLFGALYEHLRVDEQRLMNGVLDDFEQEMIDLAFEEFSPEGDGPKGDVGYPARSSREQGFKALRDEMKSRVLEHGELEVADDAGKNFRESLREEFRQRVLSTKGVVRREFLASKLGMRSGDAPVSIKYEDLQKFLMNRSAEAKPKEAQDPFTILAALEKGIDRIDGEEPRSYFDALSDAIATNCLAFDEGFEPAEFLDKLARARFERGAAGEISTDEEDGGPPSPSGMR